MADHTIGIYNMSFMSDKTIPIGKDMAFASEAAFLARLYNKPDERRSYWINAQNLLKSFILDKKPSMIGLQEMNLTALGSNHGTNAIDIMLKEINIAFKYFNFKYKQISKQIVLPTMKLAVSIIYNTEIFGNIKNEDKHIKIIDNINQNGRPLLMILTTNDKNEISLLVTVNGAQDPKLRTKFEEFNKYMIDKNKTFLEDQIKIFLEDNQINLNVLKHIFITGDINDRYDIIKDIDITTKDGNVKVSYTGLAPKSCCYNWDSSCEFSDIEVSLADKKTCKLPADNLIIDKDKGKLGLGSRGAIKNYRYTGDKVFGLYPKKDSNIDNIQIYRPHKFKYDDDISKESDHELVYATFSDTKIVSGGKRNSHINKKYKSHKIYKSHKKLKKTKKLKVRKNKS